MINKYLMVLVCLIAQTKAPFPNVVSDISIEYKPYDEYEKVYDAWEDQSWLTEITRVLFIKNDPRLNLTEMKKEFSSFLNQINQEKKEKTENIDEEEIEKMWILFCEEANEISKQNDLDDIPTELIEKAEAKSKQNKINKEREKQIKKNKRNQRISRLLSQIKSTTKKEEREKLNQEIYKIRVKGAKTLNILYPIECKLRAKIENGILIRAVHNRIEQIKAQIMAEDDTEKRLRTQLGINS